MNTSTDDHPEALPPDEGRRLLDGLRARVAELEARMAEVSASNAALTADLIESRKTQDALREGEQRFMSAFEYAATGMALVALDGRWLKVNHSLCLLLGYSAAELMAKTFQDITHPDDLETDLGYVRQMLAGEIRTYQMEKRYFHKLGPQVSVRLSVSLVRDRLHEPLYFISQIEDITDRKRTEAALRASEERLRTIVRDAEAGYFRIGLDGRYEDVNAAWLRLHGYATAAQVVGQHFAVTQAEGTLEQAQANVERLLAGAPIPRGEFARRCADGTIGYHTFSAVPVRRGGDVVGLEGFLIDITAQKRAAEAMRESEQRLRAVLDATPFPIAIVDIDDDNIAFWSRSALTLFGHTAATASQWYEIAYPDPEYRADVVLRWKPFVEQARRSGQAVNTGEYRITCRDGSVRICELFAAFLADSLIVTFNDVTSRKRLEAEHEALEAQYGQLQKAESLGRMAGAIAHNFNNQLQAILGNVELALDDLAPHAAAASRLAAAMQAARKASELSALMLTYLGQSPRSSEPIDLAEECRRSLEPLRASVPGSVDIDADLPSPGPIIEASARQIGQVCANLVTNACEALGGRPGVIRVSVATVPSSRIPAAGRVPVDWQPADGSYACLEVADTGSGIPNEHLENLFDPFFTTKFTGRGLGLPVVMGIARAHRGAVAVDTTLGRGSTFRVYLPLSDRQTPRSRQAAPPTSDFETGGVVLVVEDEQAVRQVARSALVRLGFTVLEAGNGTEALDVCARHKREIRAVLCDLTMPGMDGWETLSALRAIAPGIPVILASGYDQAQVITGEHPEWPQAFLGKPYQSSDLRDALRLALSADASRGR
jgi:two-component system, cell cycle sensor histidine kinase and response regulator CckA